MHIYFSGIGGAGIGPLALIAHQAGYSVTGSDKKRSQYTDYLQKHGIELHIGQSSEQIAAAHAKKPIDWIVMSSAVPLENPNHPELLFANQNDIKVTKRDALLNQIIIDKKLRLLAVAGTHGKTTTTAMLIWGCKQLAIPVSYSVGAKTNFADMGHYEPNSVYFLYECDEYDHNFLHFNPYISGITNIDWDHHDIYPTRKSYIDAFSQFVSASAKTIIFSQDFETLSVENNPSYTILYKDDPGLYDITLAGAHNRENALIAAYILQDISGKDLIEIYKVLSTYPGSERRFEKIAPNIYSDYAHTPEEITATIQLAHELNDRVVVVYEPLTNKRQHAMKDLYADIFEQVEKVYWVPSYLAREDPTQHVLTPDELVARLSANTNATSANLDENLLAKITQLASEGVLVLCLAGGGGNSLDEYLRANIGTIK